MAWVGRFKKRPYWRPGDGLGRLLGGDEGGDVGEDGGGDGFLEAYRSFRVLKSL